MKTVSTGGRIESSVSAFLCPAASSESYILHSKIFKLFFDFLGKFFLTFHFILWRDKYTQYIHTQKGNKRHGEQRKNGTDDGRTV